MHQDDTAEIIGTLMAFSPLEVFSTALMLVKLMLIIIAVAGLIAVVTALVRRLSGSPRSSLLAVMGQIGLYAGLAGAGYQGMVTFLTAQATHTTRFVIYEPQVIEGAYVLLLGVIVWLVARLGNAGAKRA